MAAETILSGKMMEDIVLSGEKDVIKQYSEVKRINGTDMIAGYVVTTSGETDPDVDLVGGGEAPLGVLVGYASEADKKASYSIGVTIADNADIVVLRRTGGRVKVQVLLHRTATVSAAVSLGTPIFCSVTSAGLVSSVKPTTANIEALRFLGYAAEAFAVAITASRVMPIWM